MKTLNIGSVFIVNEKWIWRSAKTHRVFDDDDDDNDDDVVAVAVQGYIYTRIQ